MLIRHTFSGQYGEGVPYDQDYFYSSGTSLSTPMLAGAFGLM